MERRLNPIETVLQRIEKHVARWREEVLAREAGVEAHQDRLWTEATERERLLAGTIEGEESRQRSAGEICQEQRAVFVMHSQEAKKALEGLSREGVRLARVIPAQEVSRGGAGLEGSWLLFE